MLNDLLLHPVTKETLLAILDARPHAILLRGKRGMGKGFTATILAADLLGCTLEQLAAQPYYLRILPDNDVIKIEKVRELKQFMQLKTTGDAEVRRVIVIEDIMTMGDEAQNALLKLLEEPPADTVFILTSTPSLAVRATIISRSQVVTMLEPPQNAVTQYFLDKGYDLKAIERAQSVGHGSVGLMQAILDNDEHPLLAQINLAKELLTSNAYQRLTKVESLSKDRLGIETLLEALTTICAAGLRKTAKTNDAVKLKRWHRSLTAVDEATQALQRKPSGKLLLTNLFLQL